MSDSCVGGSVRGTDVDDVELVKTSRRRDEDYISRVSVVSCLPPYSMVPLHSRRLPAHLDNVKSELTNPRHPVARIVKDAAPVNLGGVAVHERSADNRTDFRCAITNSLCRIRARLPGTNGADTPMRRAP